VEQASGRTAAVFARLWFRGVLLLLFACLWFRGAHPSVVSRGAILTICLPVGSRGSPVCGFAGCYSYYMPVCGFAGLTRLWFRGVLFLLLA
jgi:hypothetical protein